MTVLVTAASKHGATLEIAAAIARALEERHCAVELADIDTTASRGGDRAW
jgi:menaquinone-dependent protoporphyrinogen IX oxidase